MYFDEVNRLVTDELNRIEKKWGRAWGDWYAHPDSKFRILAEEVGEVATGLNDRDYENVRDELVQVIAVATSWLLTDWEYPHKETEEDMQEFIGGYAHGF